MWRTGTKFQFALSVPPLVRAKCAPERAERLSVNSGQGKMHDLRESCLLVPSLRFPAKGLNLVIAQRPAINREMAKGSGEKFRAASEEGIATESASF